MNWPVFIVAPGAGFLIVSMLILFRRWDDVENPNAWLVVTLASIITMAVGAALI